MASHFSLRLLILLALLAWGGCVQAEEEGLGSVQAPPSAVPVQAPEVPSAYFPQTKEQPAGALLMQPERSVQDQKKYKTGSVSLMADASLIIPISLIAREFSQHYHVPVALEFGATGEQVQKIEQGADVNVLISAQPRWIKELQDQGLIDIYSRSNIARNYLVLAVPRSVPPFALQGQKTAQLLQHFPTGNEDFRFGFADAKSLSEGGFVIEAMNMLGLDDELKLQYSLFRDVDSMAHAIEDFGFFGAMYETDTYLHPKLHSASRFPADTHSPIIYQAVVVAGDHMDDARRFVAYLKAASAQKHFARYGFAPVQE